MRFSVGLLVSILVRQVSALRPLAKAKAEVANLAAELEKQSTETSQMQRILRLEALAAPMALKLKHKYADLSSEHERVKSEYADLSSEHSLLMARLEETQNRSEDSYYYLKAVEAELAKWQKRGSNMTKENNRLTEELTWQTGDIANAAAAQATLTAELEKQKDETDQMQRILSLEAMAAPMALQALKSDKKWKHKYSELSSEHARVKSEETEELAKAKAELANLTAELEKQKNETDQMQTMLRLEALAAPMALQSLKSEKKWKHKYANLSSEYSFLIARLEEMQNRSINISLQNDRLEEELLTQQKRGSDMTKENDRLTEELAELEKHRKLSSNMTVELDRLNALNVNLTKKNRKQEAEIAPMEAFLRLEALAIPAVGAGLTEEMISAKKWKRRYANLSSMYTNLSSENAHLKLKLDAMQNRTEELRNLTAEYIEKVTAGYETDKAKLMSRVKRQRLANIAQGTVGIAGAVKR